MTARTYQLEVLTPVIIGGQDKIQNFEFIREGDNLRVVNFDKLFELSISKQGLLDTVVRALETNPRTFRLNEVLEKYAIDANRVTRYRIKLDGVKGNANEIVAFIKSAGRAYIPGSSLKGAMRSFITKALKDDFIKKYEEALEKAGDKKFNTQDKKDKVNPQEVDNYPENSIFQQPHFSPFKFLQVSDSEFVPYDRMCIYEIKVMNICNGNVKWYNSFNKGENFDNPQQGLSILAEGISPGTHISGKIKVDDGFVTGRQPVAGLKDKLSVAGENRGVEFLAKAINLASERYIIKELEFYQKYKVTQIVAEYTKLLKLLKSLAPNQFLIQLGFSTGYLSKTVGMYFKKDSFEKLKIIMGEKSKIHKELFPKTRRVIFKNGAVSTIPGWVKVTIV
ncbi:type III-A CRISPR-associated RAMP protein Csm5 [Caldicellulosiruptor morganii]|uniref:CRISPR system Cms protein Csm5 n=1 Tax=Caldicellulosiruptor morganii TaxID=1387555 RepID=A0ABY7BM46_9FIRM|nr:type III-A CRISPR-associated RAMP protein Csm5 [Caldicellulosiruptor morganii]WAM33895.1 type III-A CRISPR-associated RAMP protein Csm5 [Caldicellulosiruptor morganii]